MSTSKKARVSSPADEEMEELWYKYGRDRRDGLANSLKKDTNQTGYKHVYAQSSGTYSFRAMVHDIHSRGGARSAEQLVGHVAWVQLESGRLAAPRYLLGRSV